MLNAYRGIPSDTPAVAPEFWYLYPARLLGVDMIAFGRDVPFWLALKTTFTRWECEGWGAAFGSMEIEGLEVRRLEKQVAEGRYRETTVERYRGREYVSSRIFDVNEPSAVERYPAETLEDIEPYLEMRLSPEYRLDLGAVCRAHAAVGESYLLEYWLGLPFFDWVAEAAGFERAVYWITALSDEAMERLRARYTQRIVEVLDRAARETPFESFAIGCSASCNSLLGPALWRKLDKPFIREVVHQAHERGKLVHVHFHGRSMDTVSDFAELGIDCVCPFERPPGGDVVGMNGLRAARAALAERVTFNGNVHTVETLIRGTPEDARREVREIREAFQGSARFIIGTGDQVGRETPDANIAAMVEEARRP
jgi:hypothetical protein